MLATTLNTKPSQTGKQIFQIAGCKGVIEPSRPYKFRMWAFVEELGVRTSDVFTNDKADGENLLLAKINELRQTVPARLKAFERLETGLKAKFANLRHGYEFLNSEQSRWRNASAERLLELCEIVEALEPEESPTVILPIKSLESMNGATCPKCGRETYQGKTCLKCELTSVKTDIAVKTEAETKSKSKTLPSSREILESPYLKPSSGYKPRTIANVRY